MKKMHILEPVFEFYVPLEKNMAKFSWAIVHKVGLGESNREIKLPKSDLHKHATFVMNSANNKNESFSSIKIVTPTAFFESAGIKLIKPLPALHVNCEGCEYEVFESFYEERILNKFSVIQISFHYYDGIKNLFSRYCRIRNHLSQHYDLDPISVSFGWERWTLRI